ncbi:hypothetical protein ACFWNT_46730 [Streptomyces sp. NPDC058409]|uniref:hypothetical protein n=1 Tax=Streptomyces sp. NPDC058409 TaxID=3346484 RepID=UPI00366701BB
MPAAADSTAATNARPNTSWPSPASPAHSSATADSPNETISYLARLAETMLTPAERAERARAALKEWNGYVPTPAEQADLDSELDRRLAQVTSR